MSRVKFFGRLRFLINKNNQSSEREMLTEMYRTHLMEALTIEKLNEAWLIARKEVDEEMSEKKASESKKLSLTTE